MYLASILSLGLNPVFKKKKERKLSAVKRVSGTNCSAIICQMLQLAKTFCVAVLF